MEQVLTESELAMFAAIPEVELVDLAIELEIPVGESIDRTALLGLAVLGLAELATREGLPFSPYDQDDLEALPGEHLAAIARTVGAPATVSGVLKQGAKVYKTYRRSRGNSQIPLMLPMLLPALGRHLAERTG
ncbi:MAG: hypothetical protein H6742_02920 [Alphaproteobacteria bacterium]|nr:hypothetical protein [Alphaproteobacteria bacterium]